MVYRRAANTCTRGTKPHHLLIKRRERPSCLSSSPHPRPLAMPSRAKPDAKYNVTSECAPDSPLIVDRVSSCCLRSLPRPPRRLCHWECRRVVQSLSAAVPLTIDPGLAKYALTNGQPVNSVLNGVLPLHAACSGGNELIVRLLIEHGADVNAPR